MFNQFNNGFNNNMNPNNQSKFANQYQQQQMNDMLSKFKSTVSGMDQDTMNNLINQAKKFGLSDNQINQGIDIINSIRRGNK